MQLISCNRIGSQRGPYIPWNLDMALYLWVDKIILQLRLPSCCKLCNILWS